MAFKKKQEKHLRLNFYKAPNRHGKLVTRVRVRREEFTPKKERGLFHKLTNFSDVASGDIPSVTTALNSVKPKNKVGKAALTAAKGAYRTVRFTAKTTVKTAHIAEDSLLFTADVMNPKRQAQLKFTREQKPNGKYKTNVSIYYKDKPEGSRRRGVMRESIDFLRNAEGDAPSLTKKLNSVQPKTFGGKAALGAAKGTYTFVKAANKTLETSVIATEGAVTAAADHTVRHYKRKLREASADDSSRAILKTSSLAFTAVSRHDRYRQAKKEYKSEKDNLRTRKAERKYIIESNKKFLTSEGNAYHASKNRFIERKKAFKISQKSEIGKQRYKQSKYQFKAERKSFKRSKRHVRAANKMLKKRVKNQRRIKNLKKPQFTTGAAAAYWNKLQSSSGENNDTAKAITAAANAAASFLRENKTNELERAEKRERKLEKKSNKLQSEIKKKQYSDAHFGKETGSGTRSNADKSASAQKSAEKAGTASSANEASQAKRNQKAKGAKPESKNTEGKKSDKKINHQPSQPKRFGHTYNKSSGASQSGTEKKPHFKWQRLRKKYGYDENKPAEENAKEIVKNVFYRVGHIAAVSAGKAMLLLIPIVAVLLCVNFLVMAVASVFENSNFIIGTYMAKDVDLSDAVYEYTRTAMLFNENVISCGKPSTYKDGLYNLHAIENKSELKTTPTKFEYSGDKFSCSPGGYDFDPFVLWSFMCAFYYDFEKSEKAQNGGDKYTPEYWKLDNRGLDAIQKLFDEEYEFHFDYNDQSHWEDLPESVAFPDEPKVYYTIYSSFYTDRIQLYQAPTEIWRFAKNKWVGFNHKTKEILNLNSLDEDGNPSRTGYFLMDQRYTYYGIQNVSGGELPQFYYHDDSGNYFWGDWKPRQGFGWSDESQIYFCVSPGDTKDFTGDEDMSDKCLVTYLQEKQWVNDITLSYVVEQKCSFIEAAKAVLNEMDSYGSERLSYFGILLGDEKELGALRGNHQQFQCPLKDKTMKDLISEDRIYNGYGYDVQTWNEIHCSIKDRNHEGLDISCTTYESVVSPVDGKIIEITDNKIVIENTGIKFWYEENKKYPVKITIDNVRSSGVSVGDEIKKGDPIGNPTANHRCIALNNVDVDKIYIHLSIEIKYKQYDEVDPLLLIE